MRAPMDDAEFDKALVKAAFSLAGARGWDAVSVAAAAREGGLDLARARERFPGRWAILLKFGRMADQAALAAAPAQGTTRDRLFYLLMQRIDVLQEHRAGVLSLLRRLPVDPPLALLLDRATKRSMRWLLEAAGVPTRGLLGEMKVHGLYAVWLWGVRAWRSDETSDLSATMSAVDSALARAERIMGWLGSRDRSDAAAAEPPAAPAPEAEPPAPETPPPPELAG